MDQECYLLLTLTDNNWILIEEKLPTLWFRHSNETIRDTDHVIVHTKGELSRIRSTDEILRRDRRPVPLSHVLCVMPKTTLCSQYELILLFSRNLKDNNISSY